MQLQSCSLNISRCGYSIKQILQRSSGKLSFVSSPELPTGLTITLYPAIEDPAVESLRHDAICKRDIWLVAREVILDAFIENAEVHLEQAIEALERCRFIGVIPCT